VKVWLTLLTLVGIMAATVITMALVMIFSAPVWTAVPVTLVTVVGLAWLGTRENVAPPLVMKESVWNDEDNEQKEDK